MKLTQPIKRPNISNKLRKKYQYLTDLIAALNTKELPQEFVDKSNQEIEVMNRISDDDPSLLKRVSKSKSLLSKRMMKDLKFVPKHFYRTIWMTVGMSAIGLPFGVTFGLLVGNMAFLGIGLPIGFGLGMLIGSAMDQKAAKEGRQLTVGIA